RGSVLFVDDALGQLEAATAELGQRALFGLGDAELAAALTRLADVCTRLSRVQAALVREAEGRGLPETLGYPSTTVSLRERLRCPPSPAKQLVTLGRLLDARPALGEAVERAAVNPEQASRIGAALDALAGRVEPALIDKAEAVLIAEANTFAPQALAALGERILAHVAPELADEQLAEKLQRDERRAFLDRAFTLIPEPGSGRTKVAGWL